MDFWYLLIFFVFIFFFFFSSRRRHTRYIGDWSSDVCSSDLVDVRGFWRDGRQSTVFVFADAPELVVRGAAFDQVRTRLFIRHGFYEGLRSEERRVGKECRAWWWP